MVPDLEPGERPAFLSETKAEATAYAGEPDLVPLFDHELLADNPEAPALGVQNRYREIARRHALGQTNNQIAAALGYTASRLSIILRDPFVQTEIGRWREALFDDETIANLKEAARFGSVRIRNLIVNPKTDDRVALTASQFAIEKVTGKAKQEVSVQSESLTGFMDMLREMRNRNEALDVTPKPLTASTASGEVGNAAPQADRFSAWIAENI